MNDIEFSPVFCRLIQSAIPAVDAAELLLVFRSRPSDWLSAADASGKLGPGITMGDTLKYIDVFMSQGLLAERDGRYQFRADTSLAEIIDTLAQAYAERPVTLVRIIYALRDSKIQSFAEAFNLRRK